MTLSWIFTLHQHTHNTLKGGVIDSHGFKWSRGEYILHLYPDRSVCLSPVENVTHTCQSQYPFPSADIHRHDSPSLLMESQISVCSALSSTCKSLPCSLVTNACVSRQACVGLAGFLVLSPQYTYLKKTSVNPCALYAPFTNKKLSLCARRILCLGSLAGYLGEGQRCRV